MTQRFECDICHCLIAVHRESRMKYLKPKRVEIDGEKKYVMVAGEEKDFCPDCNRQYKEYVLKLCLQAPEIIPDWIMNNIIKIVENEYIETAEVPQ